MHLTCSLPAPFHITQPTPRAYLVHAIGLKVRFALLSVPKLEPSEAKLPSDAIIVFEGCCFGG